MSRNRHSIIRNFNGNGIAVVIRKCFDVFHDTIISFISRMQFYLKYEGNTNHRTIPIRSSIS